MSASPATACLGWVARQSPIYSPGEVASPHFAFDYVLVLGALLAAADLAFIETQLRPLGDQWAFHLLLVSVGYFGLAFRFDSRTLFGLALTTFAAWRGVAAVSVERSVFGFFEDTDAVRLNALNPHCVSRYFIPRITRNARLKMRPKIRR